MPRMPSRAWQLGLGAVFPLLVGACTPFSAAQPRSAVTSSPASSPTQSACVIGTLQSGPDTFAGYGVFHLGPIWLSAFDTPPGSPARFAAGGPLDGWKVVVHPDPHATGVVELSAQSCQTNAAVHFCYVSCYWPDRTQSPSVLRVDTTTHLDYTGYMVFPVPGLMRFTVSRSGTALTSGVVEVPPPSGE